MLTMIETIRKLLNTAVEFSSTLTKNVVDETSIGSKTVVNTLSKKKPKPPPSPDDTTSSVQTKGYCYVGEWEGVRSCVRVDKTPCEDKVYSTKQACVNPELR
jgi:hypothetical protein